MVPLKRHIVQFDAVEADIVPVRAGELHELVVCRVGDKVWILEMELTDIGEQFALGLDGRVDGDGLVVAEYEAEGVVDDGRVV